MYWGVAIPGLAMNNIELPDIPGLLRLQNPEVGDGPLLSGDYSLEQVAEYHLETILSLNLPPGTSFEIMGISMGAMIAAILGTRYRSRLPKAARFRLLSTSPNLDENPAIIPDYTQMFLACKRGDPESFASNLGLLFSQTYRLTNPKAVQEFFQYRAAGGNQQSGKALFRQLAAIRGFRGKDIIPSLNASECTFISGDEDEVFGERHRLDLVSLLPAARHHLVNQLGHMSSIEKPLLYREFYGE
jgi:pimeloyl-ACP methyl ester carboxylesterase